MPWLQLEEENLDEVKSPLVRTRKQETELPTIMVRTEIRKYYWIWFGRMRCVYVCERECVVGGCGSVSERSEEGDSS